MPRSTYKAIKFCVWYAINLIDLIVRQFESKISIIKWQPSDIHAKNLHFLKELGKFCHLFETEWIRFLLKFDGKTVLKL